MPFGIDQDEIAPTFRSWHPRVQSVDLIPFRFPRGLRRLLLAALVLIPPLRRRLPTLVHLGLAAE
jgi:hypothetical protein